MKIKAKYKIDGKEDFIEVHSENEETGKKLLNKILSRKVIDPNSLVFETEEV